ncbi:hypothetical protein OJ253_1018 [Cryptosporidium canis]|uniref:PPIase cyclophilin-type domain-containing protein n=1 Tax=Cryptosporidium canis TaxID=195482 RepID=A0A9D5DJZ6_9CRYT|nr:hypothetical protein OJ253_1018 [Cryptosporidium canis]
MNADLPTTGKLIFETTLGEIDIELWCKECPIITRRFLELCEGGFFNGKSVFKVFKGQFVVLGEVGIDLTDKFEYESNSRLKFKRRGMVGLFNDDEYARSIESPNQIFITMDKIGDFDRYTLFGKVVNNTIYNLIEIQNFEVDHNFCPKLPIRIVKTIVIMNPFLKSKIVDQKIQRLLSSAHSQPLSDSNANKLINNRNLLSFYQDADNGSGIGASATLDFDYKELVKKRKNSFRDSRIAKINRDSECINSLDDQGVSEDNRSTQDKPERHQYVNKEKESLKIDQMETIEKLKEFSVRLKKSLRPNNDKWYNKDRF